MNISRLKKKTNKNKTQSYCLQEMYFKYKDNDKLALRWGKVHQTDTNKNKAGISIFVSDKI